VPSTAATPAITVNKPVINLIIIILLKIKGAGPPNGVTTVNDVSTGSVPSRSVVTRGLENVTLFELLIVVSVDNETPNATTFGKYLDVFGVHLEGDLLVESCDHLLIGVAENAPTLGRSTTCSPIKIVLFDVRNQGGHFGVHVLFLHFLSLYLSIDHRTGFVKENRSR